MNQKDRHPNCCLSMFHYILLLSWSLLFFHIIKKVGKALYNPEGTKISHPPSKIFMVNNFFAFLPCQHHFICYVLRLWLCFNAWKNELRLQNNLHSYTQWFFPCFSAPGFNARLTQSSQFKKFILFHQFVLLQYHPIALSRLKLQDTGSPDVFPFSSLPKNLPILF